MELTDSLKTLLIETAKSLKGSARRLCMAGTVQELGPGGPQRAARALRWGRRTMRKGLHALDSGVIGVDALARRGRQRAAAPLPTLLTASEAIVESQSQAAPPFRSTRLSTRLTAAEVRRPFIAHKGDADPILPTAETLGTPWHDLGSFPQKVAKRQPPKTFQHLTPSATTSLWSRRARMRRRPWYASRWMPKRASESVRLPAVARAASRRPRLTTPFPQTPPCPPWASSCQRWRNGVCLASPPK